MIRIPGHAPLTILRDFLLENGYTAEQLKNEFGLTTGLYANLANLQPLLARTRGEGTLPLLARLFFIGWPVSQEQCRKHIPDHILDLCLEANVLIPEGDTFSPPVVVMPFENGLFALDAPRLRGTNPDIVIGPSSTTQILTKCAFRTRVRSALDIGTGTGVLATIAAGFSEEVIATDINSRAIEFARFNAALNGIEKIQFVAGDAFAPAEGKRFSLILANPPFFLSAGKHFVYSDSPLKLDGFTRRLAMEAPKYLEENGVFQMICEWVEIEGEPWHARLRSWTAGSGCDVFVYVGPSSTPVDYSEHRFQEARILQTGSVENLMEQRLNYLLENRVTQVVSGVITIRKRTGTNWFEAISGDLTIDAAVAIRKRMDALTILNEYTADQWMDARFRFAPDAVVTETRAFRESGWELATLEVSKPGGIKDPLKVDPPVLRTIELFDGRNTLQEIIAKTAQRLAIPEDEAKKRCLMLTRRLVHSSLIVPVNSETDGSQK